MALARSILSPEEAIECLARNLARTMSIGPADESERVVYRKTRTRPLVFGGA